MKILYSWLKEFIPLEFSPEELSRHLLALGFEVSDIRTLGASFTGVKVAEITKITRHPNADKLSLCEVNDGAEKTTVVCGAGNITVGQKIPLAKVGADLCGKTLKKARIRGVDSEGMICSADELGLPSASDDRVVSRGSAATEGSPPTLNLPGSGSPSPEAEGSREAAEGLPLPNKSRDGGLGQRRGNSILVLPPGSTIGADAATILAKSDHVLELEILPNRPDCLSHLGIARELSVYFRMPLNKPSASPVLSNGNCIPITIENPEHCPRYAGMTIENIKAVQSPEWLVWRLEAMGTKPRNIVVDVTNYVLYELGQPLHAFDLDTLKGPEIRVRFAKPGERFLTLEGQDLNLESDSLVIADRDRPAALAGIIGGSETGVSDKTSRIFLESAFFHPPTVRRTSRRFGIRTEASYRFERGADINSPAYAAHRAAELILRLCAGAKANKLSDNYPVQSPAVQIKVSPQKVNSILGTDLSDEKIFSALKAVAKDVSPLPGSQGGPTQWKFVPPGHRRDLHNVWDIAEEVARLSGYDIIPADAAPVKPSFSEAGRTAAPLGTLANRMRKRISGIGFYEVYNYDFISARDMSDSGLAAGNCASLANPLSSDWEILRPSLLPGLLRTLRYNLARGFESLYIFEIGTVYDRIGREVRECTHCAGLILGRYPSGTFWRNKQTMPADFFHLKGVVSRMLKNFSKLEMLKTQKIPDTFHPGICLEIIHDHSHLGWYGKIHPRIAANWGLKNPDIWIFEFALDPLSQDRRPDSPGALKLTPVSDFPSAWRDISVTLDSGTPWDRVLKTVLEASAKELASVELIDLYDGKGIPESAKSLTMRLTFCSMDRTLNDTEVELLVGKILKRLSSSLGARLRN